MTAFRTIAIAAVSAAIAATGAALAQPAWHKSKYGEDDVLGALNNLSPAGVRQATRLVRTGKVYSLAIPTSPAGPAYGSRRYEVTISPAPGGNTTPNGTERVTSYDERVVTSMGIGTQMDGFGHLGVDHHYYNGFHADELNTKEGFKKLDFGDRPPIVTRGVIIDMAAHYKKPNLVVGDVFGRAEIEAAARAQGIRIRKGDVVIFHTGWMRAMMDKDRPLYSRSEPGLSAAGAQYLADLGVVAVGADTIALDALPAPQGQGIFAAHQTLLAKNGVHVLENINTAPLVDDRVKEFLFVLGQPRFVGTVQVVVNPVAIT